jgi:hypothetical protein
MWLGYEIQGMHTEFWWGLPLGICPIGRPTVRREDNINKYLTEETGHEDTMWAELAHNAV